MLCRKDMATFEEDISPEEFPLSIDRFHVAQKSVSKLAKSKIFEPKMRVIVASRGLQWTLLM